MPVQDSSQAPSSDMPVADEVEVPEQTTEKVSAEEEQQPEQKFTRAEVEAMFADFEKKVDSRIQSQVAKSENRTQQRIQERFTELEGLKTTLNLTEEQVEAAKDKIISEEQKRSYQPQSPTGNETRQPAADPEAQSRQFMQTMDGIFLAEGVKLDQTDKEWIDMVKPVWEDPNGDPLSTLFAIRDATRAKKSRLAALKGTAAARTTGGGGSNANTTKPRTAEEKISTGLKKTEWRSDTPQK